MAVTYMKAADFDVDEGVSEDDDRDMEGRESDNDENEDAEEDEEEEDSSSSDDDDDDDDEDNDDDDDDDDDDEDESDHRIGDNGGIDSTKRQRTATPRMSSSPTAYVSAAGARQMAILDDFNVAGPSNYAIEPVGAAPHSAHVHAMAMTADGTNLLTGGSDGHIRRYDVYASMNGKTLLTQNVRHPFVDGVTKAGVMTAWWANEEHAGKRRRRNGHIGRANGNNEDDDEDDDSGRDGERLVSPVHSLAVQQDALWCTSGLESGNINLYSLRHETGGLRHVLRRHKGAVSAMTLGDDDMSLISGGWDCNVHQWDLNTGQVVRSFPGHSGQISSLSFRPLQRGETYSAPPSPVVAIRASALEQQAGSPRERIPSPAGVQPLDAARDSPVKAVAGESPQKSVAPEKPATPAQPIPRDTVKKEVFETSTPALDMDDDEAQQSSLFGDKMDIEGDLNDALKPHESMADISMDEDISLAQPNPVAPPAEKIKGDDSDGDSLFGGASADGSADPDADGEVDEDAEDVDADGEIDAEGEDDDATGEEDELPLAALAAVRPAGSSGLELPGVKAGSVPASAAPGLQPTPAAPQPNGTAPAKESTETDQKRLPKPAFGSASAFASYDADTTRFSNDILLTSTLGGQVALWDRRVPSYSGGTSGTSGSGASGASDNGLANGGSQPSGSQHKGVRALALPERTPPWCMSACWSGNGDKIYVGRRNETVDEWDLRMLPDVSGTDQADGLPPRLQSTKRGNARFVRSLRFPTGSGPVTSVLSMPNSRHLVCGSFDNVRIWDTLASAEGSGSVVPFRIVAGHHGGTISQMLIDPTSRFLFTASGDRGWYSTSTEAVIMHEVRSVL